MSKIRKRLTGATCGLAALAAAVAAPAASASVPVDLRVVSDSGGNLADLRQYVPATTTVKTYAGDDCFDPTPPIKQSSGASYPLSSPTMLAAIWEAGQVEPALQPVRLSDADFASFGALSVCQINAKTPPGFFFLKSNHQALMVGADLFTVVGGEELLAYRTPPDFSADEELELTAPTRDRSGSAGDRQRPRLQRHPGPARRAPRSPAATPRSSPTRPGTPRSPSARPGNTPWSRPVTTTTSQAAALSVCVAANPAQECPDARGRTILGSDEDEGIKGTDGDDVIRPRAGKDGIKAREGDDRVISKGGGSDKVDCGPGDDVVKRDGKDRIAKSCEKVKGKGKKGKRKKKGGAKK